MTTYSCADCDYASPKWFGRCPECGAWGGATGLPTAAASSAEVTTLEVGTPPPERFTSGVAELDRVLGGGFVPGVCALLAGEPGIGKSTLVLQLLDGVGRSGQKALLVSGEESLGQVALRARRLGVAADAVRVAATTSLEATISAGRAERPDVLVVDSVQTLESDDATGPAGSIVQVRDCAAALVRFAKETDVAVVLVGHVTKDGNVAGPKTLEHIVDVVLTLEGERTAEVRLLRAAKNRFGSCEETGVFVMTGQGLEAVADPSAMLLADRRADAAGSVVFPALEGTRPVLVEIQGLVTENGAHGRRVGIGIDAGRLALISGVLAEHAKVSLAARDVFVAAAGGLTVREPASDLALALAIVSAATKEPVPADAVVIGEIGLAGEVRRVPGIARRVAEAHRLGFSTAIVPHGCGVVPADLRTVGVRDINEACAFLIAARCAQSHRNNRALDATA